MKKSISLVINGEGWAPDEGVHEMIRDIQSLKTRGKVKFRFSQNGNGSNVVTVVFKVQL